MSSAEAAAAAAAAVAAEAEVRGILAPVVVAAAFAGDEAFTPVALIPSAAIAAEGAAGCCAAKSVSRKRSLAVLGRDSTTALQSAVGVSDFWMHFISNDPMRKEGKRRDLDDNVVCRDANPMVRLNCPRTIHHMSLHKPSLHVRD
jgi:hypothetical protein